MVSFIGIPQIQHQNALINTEPLGNALQEMGTVRRQNALLEENRRRADDQQAYQRGRDAKADARQADADRQAQVDRIGKMALMYDRITEPRLRQAGLDKILKMHPGAAGLGPEYRDPTSAFKLIAAEAGQWRDPREDQAADLDLEMKRAQIEKVRWEQEQASARQKALYDAFMGGGTATPPQPTPSEPASLDEGVGRWATPGLVGGGAGPSQPQTPQEIFQSLPPNKRAQAQVALAQGDMKEFGKIIGEGAPQLADNLTPGEKRVDQAFAKNYEDFVLSGGGADFDKNLNQMRDVHRELTKPNGANLTGPLLGRMPDAITSFTHSKAVDARQRVEEVVQRNLRIILGAQFTQKEGENLIARAYNPALDEATNAKRLDRLISSMEKMKKAKLKAMDYFERHGTMKGFKGTTQFTADDIIADLEAPEQRNFNWTPDGGLQEAE